MNMQFIGTIDHGINGYDAYYLLTLDEIEQQTSDPQDLAREKFYELVYRSVRGPGTRFCHTVLVSPKQYSETEFIGIAQVRYDV